MRVQDLGVCRCLSGHAGHLLCSFGCGGNQRLQALVGGLVRRGSYVLDQVFGIDFRVAGTVFISYTVNGGLIAVIYGDTHLNCAVGR